jgi:hypothetical protein
VPDEPVDEFSTVIPVVAELMVNCVNVSPPLVNPAVPLAPEL